MWQLTQFMSLNTFLPRSCWVLTNRSWPRRMASLSCGAKSDASRSSMVGGMCTNSSSVGGDAVGAIAASRASTSSSCAESALPEEESCATASATQITAVVSSATAAASLPIRSEEHTSELQSRGHLVCRLLLEKKKNNK